jgi:Ca2+-binding RTX toxin-like protein
VATAFTYTNASGVAGTAGFAPSAVNYNVVGSTSNDTITTGGGADTITGGAGADTINGGAGSDTYIAGDGTAISVTLNTSTAATVTVTGGSNDSIVNIENVVGTSGNDTLVGDTAANVFTGNAGADTMTGGAGVDTFTIAQAGSNSTDGIDRITDFVAGTDVLDFPTPGAGVVNVGGAGVANVSNNATAVASTGTSVATLLANLSTAAAAQNTASAGLYADTGDTFSVQITGASLAGTDVFYVVQEAGGVVTTVTAADIIVALVGTSTAAITVATIL